MIKQISWASYWTAIGVITILYYTIVGFRYYLFDITQILSGKAKLSFKKKNDGNSKTFENEVTNGLQAELFPLINHLVQEVKVILEDVAVKSLQKNEVVFALQLLLKKYPTIKGTSYQAIVNNYIINETSNYCSIHLEEAEMAMLWVN